MYIKQRDFYEIQLLIPDHCKAVNIVHDNNMRSLQPFEPAETGQGM